MNFSDLTKTVADAWSFIWPPVLELSLLAFLLWFLATKLSERIFAKIRLLRQASALAIPSEVLEKYGIGKLIPAFATFLVIFCFYVADRAVNEIGGLLPGEVTYREDILFLKTANPERFICFWNVSEGVGSGDQLQNMITDRLTITEHERGGLLRSVNMWDAEAGKAIRGLYFCKFFLIFTAITMIVEILVGRHFWLPVLRALVVGFVLLLALNFLFHSYMPSSKNLMLRCTRLKFWWLSKTRSLAP